jgi:hypothetical protein
VVRVVDNDNVFPLVRTQSRKGASLAASKPSDFPVRGYIALGSSRVRGNVKIVPKEPIVKYGSSITLLMIDC